LALALKAVEVKLASLLEETLLAGALFPVGEDLMNSEIPEEGEPHQLRDLGVSQIRALGAHQRHFFM
jgi:hypothetical protein